MTKRFTNHSGITPEPFQTSRARADQGAGRGAGSMDLGGGTSKTKCLPHLGAETDRRLIWLLVIVGLTTDEPISLPRRKKAPKQTLDLVQREQKNFNRWFDRFIVEDEQGCWRWTGAHFRNGYGAVGYRGSATVAHRTIWKMFHGYLPDHLDLDHLCRVRDCVNPGHLEPVSRSVNLRRGAHPTQGQLGRGAA